MAPGHGGLALFVTAPVREAVTGASGDRGAPATNEGVPWPHDPSPNGLAASDRTTALPRAIARYRSFTRQSLAGWAGRESELLERSTAVGREAHECPDPRQSGRRGARPRWRGSRSVRGCARDGVAPHDRRLTAFCCCDSDPTQLFWRAASTRPITHGRLALTPSSEAKAPRDGGNLHSSGYRRSDASSGCARQARTAAGDSV
jgi:hypothetical protein